MLGHINMYICAAETCVVAHCIFRAGGVWQTETNGASWGRKYSLQTLPWSCLVWECPAADTVVVMFGLITNKTIDLIKCLQIYLVHTNVYTLEKENECSGTTVRESIHVTLNGMLENKAWENELNI